MSGAGKTIFENLFVLARPGAGKSEFIDFLRHLPAEERAERFHIGRFDELDDFPWLWKACEEDDARQARGEARLVSQRTFEGYNITMPKFRGGLVDHFNEAITAKGAANPAFYDDGTLLIEFARGRDDGFRTSLERFLPGILRRSAILFLKVSFEESYRRNSARYKPGEEESILFHKVPDRDMFGYFKEHDWDELTSGEPDGWLRLRGVPVPFVTMDNEPELKETPLLAERYGRALRRLWELAGQRPTG